jgi:coiled-coil domain-containing protein 55
MPTLAFGLNAAKAKGPLSQAPQKRKNLFNDDGSGGEEDISGKATNLGGFDDRSTRPRKSPKLDAPTKNGVPTQKYTNLSSLHAAKKQDAAASVLDPSIYDYDGAYETFHAPKDSKESATEKPSGPKYMTSLLQSAEVRKRDQLRAKEKLLQKEREAEGDEFADKEKFVTGAYKAQQEEVRKLEEEEKKRDAQEEERKKKGGGMQGFYKDLLRKDEERSALIAKAAEDAAQKPKKDTIVEDTPEELEAAKKAAELNEKGARILVNDEGEVIDKRQLLSAGLNVAAKPKTDANAATAGSATNQEGYVRPSAARNARESQRERQSRMMEAQLEEIAAKQHEQELEEEKAREEKLKSSKSTTDVQSAKERYLARKREREEEAAKNAKGTG